MTARLGAAALLAGLLAGCATTSNSPQSCKIGRLVDLPLLQGGKLPAVEASLDGQKVAVYIDTGAFVSIIDRKAAQHFNLRSGPEQGMVRLGGAGGTVNAPLVTIHRLVLGGGAARNLELPVAGALGPPVDGVPLLGLFGGDFLSNYDVDIDLPRHRFAMYVMQGCGNDPRPLGDAAFEMPFRLHETKVMLDLSLNGKPFSGFLDSGASHTLVSPSQAEAAGVTSADLAADRAGRAAGLDGNRIAAHLHRFASLTIGDETMRNVRLLVADTALNDIVLGDDFLHYNEVWISYPQRRLYIRPAPSVTRVP
ncbi:retropepsin-like aspartic protease [Lichenicoccus sp.]|uniref:retropepsin-like aspartic protease n=1 Tax=Lichenicoccus sp. TaxID=2781899 RepID=UPI003D0EEF7A